MRPRMGESPDTGMNHYLILAVKAVQSCIARGKCGYNSCGEGFGHSENPEEEEEVP